MSESIFDSIAEAREIVWRVNIEGDDVPVLYAYRGIYYAWVELDLATLDAQGDRRLLDMMTFLEMRLGELEQERQRGQQ